MTIEALFDYYQNHAQEFHIETLDKENHDQILLFKKTNGSMLSFEDEQKLLQYSKQNRWFAFFVCNILEDCSTSILEPILESLISFKNLSAEINIPYLEPSIQLLNRLLGFLHLEQKLLALLEKYKHNQDRHTIFQMIICNKLFVDYNENVNEQIDYEWNGCYFEQICTPIKGNEEEIKRILNRRYSLAFKEYCGLHFQTMYRLKVILKLFPREPNKLEESVYKQYEKVVLKAKEFCTYDQFKNRNLNFQVFLT